MHLVKTYSRLNHRKCVATLRDAFFGVFLNGTRFFNGDIYMKKLVIPFCVLCLFLVLGLTACNTDSNSQGGTDNKNEIIYLPYEIDNTGCVKRFYANENNSVNIVIPTTYSIDENGKLISGTAYEVKTIGAHCFANNNLIESVYIPDTITSIEERAFYNCANLTTINVTQNIINIGKEVFESCPKLNTVTKNGKSGLIIEENENLSSFTIPNTITKLEDDSFANWTNLSSISIGTNINYIGNNAFSHCNNLSIVNISSSLNYLGNNAFADCEKLTSLTTSNNNSGICFAPNQSLSSFVVPLSVTSIQNGFFYGWKQLKEVNIHESITSLGTIFKDNESLAKLTCGSNNVLSLFYHRPDYETKIESEKMYIVSHKPSYSGSYTYNYYIPNTLTEIHLLGTVDSYCLYNMKSVKKVYIPSTVSNFGSGAFAGCSGLTDVYFSTDSDWKYEMSYYTSDYGTISKADMNNSTQLAIQLKAHNGFYYRWYKA